MNTDLLSSDSVAPSARPNGTPPPAPNPLDEPTVEESLAEWGRYYAYPQDAIRPPGNNWDMFLAFYDGAVRGYDPDPTALRERVAAELGVHPARLVISYLAMHHAF